MPRPRRLAINPAIRGLVRAGIRAGRAAADIVSDVLSSFSRIRRSTVERLVREESDRQDIVDRVMARDKRRSIDLGELAGCPPGTTQVRIGVTIEWYDAREGAWHRWGDSYVAPSRGRLASIINDVLSRSLDAARGKGYSPPNVTSAMTSGRTRYRIDYVQCA